MNDVMPGLDDSCTVLLKGAASIALLSFALLCLALMRSLKSSKPAIQKFLHPEIDTNSPLPVVRKSMPLPHASLAPEPEPQNETEVVECGNCHKEIKSEPIRQLMPPAIPSEVFRCEHCGAEVILPV